MRKIVLFFAVLGLVVRCFGVTNGVISTTTRDGRRVVVKAVDGNIFRVSNIAPGESEKRTQAAVLAADDFQGGMASDSINMVITLPSGVSAVLDRRSGSVCFMDSTGRLLTDSGVRGGAEGKR